MVTLAQFRSRNFLGDTSVGDAAKERRLRLLRRLKIQAGGTRLLNVPRLRREN